MKREDLKILTTEAFKMALEITENTGKDPNPIAAALITAAAMNQEFEWGLLPYRPHERAEQKKNAIPMDYYPIDYL